MRKRLWSSLASAVVVTAASLAFVASPAQAAPSNCKLWFTPTNANPDFTGAAAYCRGGTGTYRVGIECSIPILPDYWKYSSWVSVGNTASVTCNWGNNVNKAESYKRS